MRLRGALLFVCLAVLTPAAAFAQNWSFDARRVALGGIGSTSNVAVDMVDEQRPYRPIVLPFGLLFQVLPNLPKFDPTSDDFNLVKVIEYSASPIHYIINRDDSDSDVVGLFVNDLRNGTLNRDLNVYRGFDPDTNVTAEGLASPNWGYTFKFKKHDDGTFQGIYVGGGPYFSMQTEANIDPALASLFASETPVYTPNTSYYMTNDTLGQFALAITGGYRARMAWPGGGGSPLEGLYIGANYHYLHGFNYEHFLPSARLDTNAQGLLVVNPALGLPVTIVRDYSSSGNGFAIDTGVAAVRDKWEVGFGVNGIGNRITWTDVRQRGYALDSLFNGGEFVEGPRVPVADAKVELPVDVRANAAYHTEKGTATTEFGHGYNGTTFRAGFEQRLNRIQLRGGLRYNNDIWEPTGGAGFDLTRSFGIDVAGFGTSANLQRERHLAIAVSLRFMKGNPNP